MGGYVTMELMTAPLKDTWICLLEIKETQMRLNMIEQANNAIDCGIHADGTLSAIISLVASS